MIRLRGDFNGLFRGGQLLCLSHSDTCVDEHGNEVALYAGMLATAFEEDSEDGRPDEILASGRVEPSPEWLRCRGSKWVLVVDENGVRHASDSVAE